MSLKTFVIRGKSSWCKIIGKAPPGFDNGPPEWSLDLYLDDENTKKLLSTGVDKFYLRKNKESGAAFVRFVRKAQRSDGTDSNPIRVVDHNNNEWDNKLIGNDSTLNVCYAINEVKSKGTKRLKPVIISVQVWDHVKYTPKGPFETKKSDVQDSDGSGPVESKETW